MDRPPADAVGLFEMLEQLGVVAAIEPIELPLMGGVPAPPVILIPFRWCPATAPLFDRLADGTLLCWGRRDGMLGPWERLPSETPIWRQMQVEDWGHGVLSLVERYPTTTIEIDRRGLQLRETATEMVAARWHGCRVAEPPVARRPGRPRIPDGVQPRPVMIARYAEKHGVAAAAERYDVLPETAATYLKKYGN